MTALSHLAARILDAHVSDPAGSAVNAIYDELIATYGEADGIEAWQQASEELDRHTDPTPRGSNR